MLTTTTLYRIISAASVIILTLSSIVQAGDCASQKNPPAGGFPTKRSRSTAITQVGNGYDPSKTSAGKINAQVSKGSLTLTNTGGTKCYVSAKNPNAETEKYGVDAGASCSMPFPSYYDGFLVIALCYGVTAVLKYVDLHARDYAWSEEYRQ